MKKPLIIFIILSIILWILPYKTLAYENNYFRVTAYYSPLKNQNYYIKWNYEAEIRMNWRWIRWASGKPVFSWMLAAPKKYSFGTKLYLEWLGIWEVSDRGSAIVKAWERNFKYDRIDVWVWYWDEGLRRAMYWGNRVIKWKIIKKATKVSINYKKIASPYWATSKLKKNSSIKKVKSNTKFDIFLKKQLEIFDKKVEEKQDIKKLQKILSDLWMYDWEINWKYNKIINVISNYQIEKKLIKNVWDKANWYFWPKTRKNLSKDYKRYLIKKEERKQKIKEFERKINKLKILSLKKAQKKLNKIWVPVYWEVSPQVRELQKILKELWYFHVKDTAIFWKKTRLALIKYQIDKKIITKSDDLWAWVFWPKTRKSFAAKLNSIYMSEDISKNLELSNYYKNNWENNH